MLSGATDRQVAALKIRQQIGAIREDAAYWRRRNCPGTADELERVAGFLENMGPGIPLAVPTGGSGTRARRPVARARTTPA